ncbi:MAG TPA: glutaminyl-peptide cyclotransferase [Gemmatimonadaceae bacterium]|nr:glutaminyl-peptide cyclotransferase [Gemmatimonadaceae bacterium]
MGGEHRSGARRAAARAFGATSLALAAAALALAVACGDDGASDAGGTMLPPGMQQPVDDPPPAPAVPFSPATPVYDATAAQSFPHDPQAFTEGFLVHDGSIYESTGLEGRSNVRQWTLADGTVQRRLELAPQYFGEGIAIVGDRLYQLTWKHHKGFVYDLETLAPVDSFTYTGEGWALTTDGTKLYMSDGTSHVRVVDPNGFRVERTIDVTEAGRPVHYVNELEWVNGELWANIWLTDWIARIDPATGHVVGWVDLGPLADQAQRENPNVDVTNGIAYDAANDRLLVTGKYWPKVYAIELKRR